MSIALPKYPSRPPAQVNMYVNLSQPQLFHAVMHMRAFHVVMHMRAGVRDSAIRSTDSTNKRSYSGGGGGGGGGGGVKNSVRYGGSMPPVTCHQRTAHVGIVELDDLVLREVEVPLAPRRGQLRC